MSARSFAIAADHPALPGHFPGHPIVPGVVVLEAVVAALAEPGLRLAALETVRFLSPLAPGEAVSVAAERAGEDRVRFACSAAGRVIARGSLRFTPAAPSP